MSTNIKQRARLEADAIDAEAEARRTAFIAHDAYTKGDYIAYAEAEAVYFRAQAEAEAAIARLDAAEAA